MTSPNAGAPPRPALAFQIGVAGHRALPDADIPALRAAAARLFRTVRAEAERQFEADQASAHPLYSAAPPSLRCLCGLAEGADALLAEAALDEGWSLTAVLPFPRDEFARDFAPGPALVTFRTLLARAERVLELDGARGRGGEPYAAVGQIVLEQSDALLVVWDGLPARGPGGTGDIAAAALERGVPLAVLPHAGPVVLEWRGTAPGSVEALVDLALAPSPPVAGGVQSYYAEQPSGAGWAGRAVRWYEASVLLGARPQPAPSAPPFDPGPHVAASEARLLPFFAPADRLATEYAARYRAAGLLRYGLILPATIGALLGFFGELWVRPAGFLLQYAALFAVIVYATRGSWERNHQRFIADRAVAEYLRNLRWLAPLAAIANPPAGAVFQARAADWPAWYGRAVVRSLGLPEGRLDAPAIDAARRFVRAEAQGQVDYLLARASRFSAIAGRLERIGVALFFCGILFIAARALFLIAGIGGRPMRAFDELSLALPALAPVFLGLLSFNEYGRLATRYRGVAAELQDLVAALDAAEPNRAAVLRVARRVAEVMLAESADWQLLVKARTVSYR